MMKVRALILGVLILGVGSMVAVSQEKEKDFPKKEGDKGKFEFKKEGGDKGPPRGGMGLLPPFLRQQLKLTEEQERKINDIEKQAREAMLDVLTKDQREMLMNFAKKEGVFPPKKDGEGRGKEGEKGKDGDRKKEGDRKEGDRKKEGDKKDGDRPPFEKK